MEYGSDKPDPSQIPAEWHGWMHHTTDEPVALRADYKPPKYVTSWVPHLTGTDLAYHPHNYPLNPGYQPRERIPVRQLVSHSHAADLPCSSRSGNRSRHSHLRRLRLPKRTTSLLVLPRFARASFRVRCVPLGRSPPVPCSRLSPEQHQVTINAPLVSIALAPPFVRVPALRLSRHHGIPPQMNQV